MICITGFQKKYPGSSVPVLSINQFSLSNGIYWLKGENGCGKTSLIKSIAGLIPFTGIIAVHQIQLATNRIGFTKIVNYAEAEPQYPPFLSGKELIGFYHSAKGGNLPNDLIKALGVDKFMQNKTAVYSSGMLKKLSLVLAFIGKPTLILLDEPLIALDVAAVETLQQTITAYSKAGVSFIITSHQPMDYRLIKINSTLSIKDNTLQIED
jgi:ABC-2 type transport system ATP-binding protein